MTIEAKEIKVSRIRADNISAEVINAVVSALFINGILQSNGILKDSTILGVN